MTDNGGRNKNYCVLLSMPTRKLQLEQNSTSKCSKTLKSHKESYSALVSAFFSPEVQLCAHTQRNSELVDQHFRDQAPLCSQRRPELK